MEFRVLHNNEPPSGSDVPVPLREDLEIEEARKIQEQEQQQHLKNIWAAVHRLQEKRAALCISGGGIRSATFALGVLQGLARCGLLGKFHYLSTVSGGGYIGGWLAAWILRAAGGLDEVSANLAKPRDDTRPNPEPTQMQNLRSYSNYLSPRLGLLSADTWTLVATYFRNLLLNWLVLIPLLAAVLTIPWIYVAVLMKSPPPYTLTPFCLGAVCLVFGLAYMAINLPSAGRGRDRGTEKGFLWFCLLPLFLGAIFITTYWAWFTNYGGKTPEWPFLNANISRQFEFLQNAWINGTKFSGLTGESDPLLGNRKAIPGCPVTSDFTAPEEGGIPRRVLGLPQIVTVRGGAYFFLPSLRALLYFAEAGNAQK